MQYSQYYEDIQVGQKRRSGTYQISEQEIIEFARVWDPQPIHIDPEFAAQTKIGSVFACAVHLLGIMTKLVNQNSDTMAIVAGLGWEKVRFVSPGLPGSNLSAIAEVTSKRESTSNPDVGIITTDIKLLNEHDYMVLSIEGAALVAKRCKK